MLRVGYRIRLSSGKGPDREGVVTALVGSMVRVRWPSQEETIVIPAPGTLTVVAPSAKKATPKKATPKKAVAKKATSRKALPTEKRAGSGKAASAKKNAPTTTRARKATGKSGTKTSTSARRQGR
jgi:hypothetical protein